MTQDNELLPCPFCGAPAFMHELEPHEHSTFLKTLIPGMPDHSGSYVIEGSCECGSGLMGDTREQVTAMWNRRAPDARDARIAELEAKLASPSPHDPGQAAIATLRSMGYEHHGGVQWAPPVREMAVCGCGDEYPANGWDAGFIAALGHCANCAAALDPVTPEPAPSTPWYPDDSGEWVEVPEDLMELPKELKPDDLVEVLVVGERENKAWWPGSRPAKSWGWRSPFAYDSRIVAYKVVKP